MKLLRRASGAIKDRNGIWLAGIARRTPFRHPELEAAIIKATSHDDLTLDYKNAQRVFQWVRTSPSSTLKPLAYALSKRVQKTRSWVVALKGLILLHGVFCCKIPAIQRIGQLPFDLSNFIDGHCRPAKAWAYSAFVRVYFAYLDQQAAYLCWESERSRGMRNSAEESIGQVLLKLQKWQSLLDLLIQIKPMDEGMNGDLIIEAIDCVIVEIFGVYSSICDGIASVLVRIYSARASEASMALRVLKKATDQSEKLSAYFEFCGEIGVLNAKEFPKVERVPEEDIREVERIISGISERSNRGKDVAIVEEGGAAKEKDGFQALITEKWEVFQYEDLKVGEGRMMIEYRPPRPLGAAAAANHNSSIQQPHHHLQHVYNEDLPDLISF